MTDLEAPLPPAADPATTTDGPTGPPPPAPGAPSPRRRRRRAVIAAVVVLALVASGIAVQRHLSAEAEKEEAARALSNQFATAWAADDFTGLAFVDQTDAEVTDDYHRVTEGLGSFAVTIQPGTIVITDDRAVSTYRIDWRLIGDIHWVTDAQVELERRDEQWRIRWTPTIVNPDLTGDTRLVAERLVPKRGEILGAGDVVVVTERPLVEVGVQPSAMGDLATVATTIATLQSVLGIDGAALGARVQAASDDAFVPVITVRRPDFEPYRAQIQALPGVVLRDSALPLGPSPVFASALLGTVGEATPEIIKESKGRYEPGELAGLTGMQARYDTVLSGQAGARVVLTNAPLPGDDDAPEPDADAPLRLDVVFEEPAIDGSDVKTTIDPTVQFAADDAAATAGLPTTIVVVKPSTGEVLAVANPAGQAENLAFTGKFAPGSAFEVVSSEAFINNRLSIGETVDCRNEVTVDGRTFDNAEYATIGKVPFREAFADSCTTAFAELSDRLSPTALTDAAARFGLGGTWSPGVPAFTGTVPMTEGLADRASATVGQGRVQVSPLGMAMVAATVEDGTWRPPVVVREPKDPLLALDGLGPSAGATPLPDGEVPTLQTLLREVVTGGTGWRVRAAPGADVSGKTGTAEVTTDEDAPTDAWFIGSQGDLAFAVLVQGGGFGGEAAGPVVVDLLSRLDAASKPANDGA